MAAPEPAHHALSPRKAVPWRWGLGLFCLAVLALATLQVAMHGPLLELDQDVSTWFSAHRDPTVTALMLAVSNLHETVHVLAATALLAAWLALRRDWNSTAALLVVPTGTLANVVVKGLLQRARPRWDDPLVQLATYSFPSGHAVASTVFYGMLCALVFTHTRSRLWRASALAFAMAMVLLVGFSRVYLGAHFPGDVLAGMALGTACVLAFLRFLRP